MSPGKKTTNIPSQTTRISLCAVLAALLMPAIAKADPVERRRDQFGTDFAYFVYPIGGDIPGLGSAFGVGGTVLNMYGTDTDFTGFALDGDFTAAGYTLLDMQPVKKRVILDIGYYDFVVAPQQFNRGMDSSPDDYILPKVEGNYWQGQATLTFDERRMETYYRFGYGASRLKEVLDKDGNAFPAIDTSERNARFSTLGMIVDDTDDRLDPRAGNRLEVAGRYFHNNNSLRSNFVTVDYNLSKYIPMRRADTVALNLFYSRAYVINQATTDRATLEAGSGLNCGLLPLPEQPQCQATQDLLIDQLIEQNTYGTATALGGTQRLRSYPNGRFYAGQSIFYGAEYRWNLTDERTPFDIFFARGIRTGLQLAVFAEQGSVANHFDDLWTERRSSVGVGFRVVLSGVIIRADYAVGSEGNEFVLFINYPWSLFSVDNPG